MNAHSFYRNLYAYCAWSALKHLHRVVHFKDTGQHSGEEFHSVMFSFQELEKINTSVMSVHICAPFDLYIIVYVCKLGFVKKDHSY